MYINVTKNWKKESRIYIRNATVKSHYERKYFKRNGINLQILILDILMSLIDLKKN